MKMNCKGGALRPQRELMQLTIMLVVTSLQDPKLKILEFSELSSQLALDHFELFRPFLFCHAVSSLDNAARALQSLQMSAQPLFSSGAYSVLDSSKPG